MSFLSKGTKRQQNIPYRITVHPDHLKHSGPHYFPGEHMHSPTWEKHIHCYNKADTHCNTLHGLIFYFRYKLSIIFLIFYRQRVEVKVPVTLVNHNISVAFTEQPSTKELQYFSAGTKMAAIKGAERRRKQVTFLLFHSQAFTWCRISIQHGISIERQTSVLNTRVKHWIFTDILSGGGEL